MEEFTGRITRHLFRADNGSYAVAKFRTSPSGQTEQQEFVIKGPLKKFSEDHEIQVTGRWENHPKYGAQLSVSTAFWQVPKDKHAIKEHLKLTVRGVGDRTLQKVVDFFGETTLDVLRVQPERINEISGISKNIAKKISSGIKRDDVVRELDLKLGDYQFPTNTANRIYEKYGDKSQQVLDEDPYALIGIQGVQFKSADRFAQQSGNFNPESLQRIRGYQYGLLKQEQDNGHTCLPVPDILAKTMETLSVPKELAEVALAELFTGKQLILERVDSGAGPIEMVFLPWNQSAEIQASHQFSRLLRAEPERVIWEPDLNRVLESLEQQAHKTLTDKQRLAVQQAFRHKLSVITGKPGTGKTTSLRAVVSVAEQFGLKVVLCAPTGRAAKNMTAATGKKAVTIHRLLEYKTASERTPGDTEMFKRNEDHQLPADLVVVDESSMMDTYLFRCLLAAIKDGARVVFVGDDNQLPSVSAGRVLHDIIRSGVCPVTELDIIHRQAAESHIILNAHRILEGKPLMFPAQNNIEGLKHTDCLFMDAPMVKNPDTQKDTEDSAWVRHIITELCSRSLPAAGVNPVHDVQVLTPRRDGPCGVNELNRLLQQVLNPFGRVLHRAKTTQEFREGDRVMVVKNNYDLNVFNGDIGVVQGYDLANEALIIEFYGEPVSYPVTEIDEGHLALSYACTVHKSQGSEYKAVVLLCLKQHGIMLARNLLYTGFTRAKQKLAIVGSRIALRIASRNIKPIQRNTLLWYRLARLKFHAA